MAHAPETHCTSAGAQSILGHQVAKCSRVGSKGIPFLTDRAFRASTAIAGAC